MIFYKLRIFHTFYQWPADSIGHYVGRSVCPKNFHFSNFSALGLDRELGFSRGPPSGTPDLNDDDDDDDDDDDNDDNYDNDDNEDNKDKEEEDNEKLFFFKSIKCHTFSESEARPDVNDDDDDDDKKFSTRYLTQYLKGRLPSVMF